MSASNTDFSLSLPAANNSNNTEISATQAAAPAQAASAQRDETRRFSGSDIIPPLSRAASHASSPSSSSTPRPATPSVKDIHGDIGILAFFHSGEAENEKLKKYFDPASFINLNSRKFLVTELATKGLSLLHKSNLDITKAVLEKGESDAIEKVSSYKPSFRNISATIQQLAHNYLKNSAPNTAPPAESTFSLVDVIADSANKLANNGKRTLFLIGDFNAGNSGSDYCFMPALLQQLQAGHLVDEANQHYKVVLEKGRSSEILHPGDANAETIYLRVFLTGSGGTGFTSDPKYTAMSVQEAMKEFCYSSRLSNDGKSYVFSSAPLFVAELVKFKGQRTALSRPSSSGRLPANPDNFSNSGTFPGAPLRIPSQMSPPVATPPALPSTSPEEAAFLASPSVGYPSDSSPPTTWNSDITPALAQLRFGLFPHQGTTPTENPREVSSTTPQP